MLWSFLTSLSTAPHDLSWRAVYRAALGAPRDSTSARPCCPRNIRCPHVDAHMLPTRRQHVAIMLPALAICHHVAMSPSPCHPVAITCPSCCQRVAIHSYRDASMLPCAIACCHHVAVLRPKRCHQVAINVTIRLPSCGHRGAIALRSCCQPSLACCHRIANTLPS